MRRTTLRQKHPGADFAGPTLPVCRRSVYRNSWVAVFVPLCLAVLMSLVTAEVTVRLFWRLCCAIPLLESDQILYAYYPELRGSGDLPGSLRSGNRSLPAQGDGFYDILFLGGSVLHKEWSSVEMELREQLAYRGHRNVRVFNLAMPAHTSRDSFLKYTALRDARFDLVVIYHGINESRANNAPPDVFRQDYSHYSWYENVNTLAPYHGTAIFALPYTMHYLINNIRQIIRKNQYISTYSVPKNWIKYGREPRSAVSFQHNLNAIIALAEKRGDQILLMTFAAYAPENYSRYAFDQKQLDYGLHRSPIEWWGPPEHVLATVAVHNQIVRKIAALHGNVLFVDQAILMSGYARYFDDVCHFTGKGSTKFVENLVRVLPLDTQVRPNSSIRGGNSE